VPARRLAGVTDGEDLADLGEGESGGAAPADEVQPGDRVVGVVPVPAGGRTVGRVQPWPQVRALQNRNLVT